MSVSSDAAGTELLRAIERAWRLLATGLSFTLFGLGSLLGGLFVLPLIWLLVRNPQRQRRLARAFVSGLMYSFAVAMATLGLLRWKVTGLEQARAWLEGRSDSRGVTCAPSRGVTHAPSRGVMIVANHPSLIDVVFLLALFPQADCVVKGTLWRNPFTALTVRSLGYISNRSPIETLQACIERLRDGAAMILFPEGTRTVPGQPLHFQDGAAAIAVRAECDLLPVAITCQPTTLTKGEPWYRIPPRRVQLRFVIHPALSVAAIVQGAASPRAASAQLNRYMVDFFEEQLARMGS